MPSSDGVTGGTGKIACQDANGGLTTTPATCGTPSSQAVVIATSSAQNGSLGSTTLVASTSATHFWSFYATINVTAVTGTPSVQVSVGTITSTTLNITGGTGVYNCNFSAATNYPALLLAASAINYSTTVVLGGGTITYTVTVYAG